MSEKKREGFTFYRSYYEAAMMLPEKERLQLFEAIMEMSLNMAEPKVDGLAGAVWLAIKPNVQSNLNKYLVGLMGAEHGSKGGRPSSNKNPKETPEKPLNNPTITPPKPQGNPEPNPNENENETENGNENEKKKSRKKKTDFIPPSEIEVIGYFVENGFTEAAAKKAFQYYEVANWVDSKGNAVKSWKQKMQGVWFKEENKAKEVAYTPPPQVRNYTRLIDWLKAHPNAVEPGMIYEFMKAGIDPSDHGACRRWLAETGYPMGEATQFVYSTNAWMERMGKL